MQPIKGTKYDATFAILFNPPTTTIAVIIARNIPAISSKFSTPGK